MKKTIKLLTMAAIIAALAFTAAGCPSGTTSSPVSPLEGTWVSNNSFKLIFSGSNFTHYSDDQGGGNWAYQGQGTFSLSGGTLTLNYSDSTSTFFTNVKINAASFTALINTNLTFIKQ